MAAFNFLKHPYIVISSFFLYITFIAHWHKIIIDINIYNKNVSYEALISVCLICLLFLLPSLFCSRRVCIIKKPVENKFRFFASRFCSGLFFLLGNYYLSNSFILSQDLIKIYKADIAWTQILAVSVFFLASFYLSKRVRLFSFVGIILFLFGFVSLFHTSRIFDHLTLLRLLFLITTPSDFEYHVSYLFLFVVFWLFTIKINKLDAKYFENNVFLWLSTLLFSILISFLILLYTEHISILLNDYESGIFIIYHLPYGMFLWFCIKLFCFLDLGNKNKVSATKKLLSFGKLDANLNVLSSYDYPASVQVADPINKKSIDNKTMLKIKDSLKNDKDFTKEVKPEQQKTQALPKITGLVPLPMDIGATDGEWTYLGRFMAPENFSSPLEWQTRMTQYTGSAEANNLYDVYFYHSHYGNSDGQGCPKGNIGAYKCVLKFVPLGRNGRPVNKSGEYYGTHLLSMTGATKGVFAACVLRLRTFDSVTHQQLVDVTNESVSGNSALNGKDYSDSSYNLMKVRHNAPYYKAMQITGCHTAWQTRVAY